MTDEQKRLDEQFWGALVSIMALVTKEKLPPVDNEMLEYACRVFYGVYRQWTDLRGD